jgi:hypothetical protein
MHISHTNTAQPSPPSIHCDFIINLFKKVLFPGFTVPELNLLFRYSKNALLTYLKNQVQNGGTRLILSTNEKFISLFQKRLNTDLTCRPLFYVYLAEMLSLQVDHKCTLVESLGGRGGGGFGPFKLLKICQGYLKPRIGAFRRFYIINHKSKANLILAFHKNLVNIS